MWPGLGLSKGDYSDGRQPYRARKHPYYTIDPAHEGVEGNELADGMAKLATEGEGEQAEPSYLREAGLSHLTRKTTEARSEATSTWIGDHVG